MCTSIVEIIEVEGKARSKDGWFAATRAVLTYDHPQFALTERDTINLDFVDPNRSASERGAVELSLDSAKALHAALGRVIKNADEEEALARSMLTTKDFSEGKAEAA